MGMDGISLFVGTAMHQHCGAGAVAGKVPGMA